MKMRTVHQLLSLLLATLVAGGSLLVASPASAENVQMAKGENTTFAPTPMLQEAHQPDSGMFEIVQPVSRGSDDLGGRGSSNDTATLYNPPGYLMGNQCAANCIIDAIFQGPRAWTADMELRVRTYFPTTVEVYLATHIPLFDQDGDPYFPGASPVATSGGIDVTDWIKRIDLEFGTHYYGIVAATDQLGNTQRKWGEFTTTQPDLRLTFHKIDVDYDGTPLGAPNDIDFEFEVDGSMQNALQFDVLAGTGDVINLFDQPVDYVVELPAGSQLPSVQVQGTTDETGADCGFAPPSPEIPDDQDYGSHCQGNLHYFSSIAPPAGGDLDDLEDVGDWFPCTELVFVSRCVSISSAGSPPPETPHPEFTVWYELELIY